MIYGLVPIGGKGKRLALSFSKEMLPQKNYEYFNPVANHLIEKMHLAGAEKIVFVHGDEFKQDVIEFFSSSQYVHILQSKLGFAQVLQEFTAQISPDKNDRIIFGLPDSVFDGNPFVEMLNLNGIVAGLFQADQNSKVDRLDISGKFFHIKTPKNPDNLDFFWGVLKFDGKDLAQFVADDAFAKTNEVGHILNEYSITSVNASRYFDLGTWIGYNMYLADPRRFANTEIERKYDATTVNEEDFVDYFSTLEGFSYEKVGSIDHYYNSNDGAIEFIRFRERASGSSWPADITLKNNPTSIANRYELTIPLHESSTTSETLQFLSLLKLTQEFRVSKSCHIFNSPLVSIVFYRFFFSGKEFKIIETEVLNGGIVVLYETESLLSKVPGFDAKNIINQSKFRMIKELLE